MMRDKAMMIVMNTLHTDARVQRAASSISDMFELTVVGVGRQSNNVDYRQVLIEVKGKKGLLRYFDFVRRAKKLILSEEYSLFYAHDYYTASLVEWVKKKRPQTLVIYDSHELIFPACGFKTSRRETFFRFFERKAIKKADLVICASEERSSLMKAYYHMQKAPLVIENISQLPTLQDVYSQQLVERIRSIIDKKSIVLTYAGVLSLTRRIEDLISIVERHPDTKLLIVGDGADRRRLEAIAEKRIPNRYFFTGGLPYNYMGTLLRKCSIGYISYPTDSLNNTFCAPNKVYEYASVGLPMIAPDNPTIRKIFEEHKIGVISNNLEMAYDEVVKNLSFFQRNCEIFSNQSQWEEKSVVLKNSIKELCSVRRIE